MKTANITLRLEKHGHDVTKTGVTPAEASLLVAEHHINAGGDPIVEATDGPDVTRTDVEEVERLKAKYGAGKVIALYPGAKPSLPATLKEAREIGLRVSIPVNKLLVKQG